MKKEDLERLREICKKEGFQVGSTPNGGFVVVSKKEKSLPKSYDEYVSEDYDSHIHFDQLKFSISAQALNKIARLRDVYRDGWKPDWDGEDTLKYCICTEDNKLVILSYLSHRLNLSHRCFLSFQDKKTAELFLKNFRDLIQEASYLLFG